MIWVFLNSHEKHLQNTTRSLFIYDGNISKIQEYNHHVLRELWTRIENMPFLPQEGRLQRARRACSRTLKGVLLSVEGHGQGERGTKIVYIFGLLSWREEDGGLLPCAWREAMREKAPLAIHLQLICHRQRFWRKKGSFYRSLGPCTEDKRAVTYFVIKMISERLV